MLGLQVKELGFCITVMPSLVLYILGAFYQFTSNSM